MIQANELMCGNYAQDNNGTLLVVDEINPIYVKARFGNIGENETNYWTIYHYDKLKPIELTEQWLIDFGFDKIGGFDDEQFFRIKTDENLLIDVYETMTGFETEQGLKIEGVHHLQNYVHSGIGKKLIKKD